MGRRISPRPTNTQPEAPKPLTLDLTLDAQQLSDREVARRGGPCADTLRAWRRGEGGHRRDAVEALGRALSIGNRAAAIVVEMTIRQARERAERPE